MPGNRANPHGRPKGSRNKTTLLVEELLANEAETLTRSLIRRAMAGNGTALSLIFARLAPVRRDRPLEIALPPVESTRDIIVAHKVIFHELGAGAISLIQRKAAVILTRATPVTRAAKAASTTVPIVFVIGADPIKIGLVASLNRPGGNVNRRLMRPVLGR